MVVPLTVVALTLGELTDVLAEKLPEPSTVAAVTNDTAPVVVAVPVVLFVKIGTAVAVVYPLCVTAVSDALGNVNSVVVTPVVCPFPSVATAVTALKVPSCASVPAVADD